MRRSAIFFALCSLFFFCGNLKAQSDSSSEGSVLQDPWKFKNHFGHYSLAIGIEKQVPLNRAQRQGTVLTPLRGQYIIRLRDFHQNRFLYRLELIQEGTLIPSLVPKRSMSYGMNEMLRFDFPPIQKERRTILHFDLGVGINDFRLRLPQALAGRRQYSPHIMFGFKTLERKRRRAYGCDVVVDHFSNKGRRGYRPNQGINLIGLSCGIDFLPKK